MPQSLTQKLVLKPGYRAAVINAPAGYVERLNPLPEGVTISEKLDDEFNLVQVFVNSKADVDRLAPGAISAVKPGGVLWFTYPKQSSKVKTDINRDKGWDVVTAADWEAIASIAVDDTWSGIRFVNRTKA